MTDPAAADPAAADPLRCFGTGDELYESYHDAEWGRAVRGDAAVFERLSLEAFQSGLSWITVLRKRPAFREVFAGFDPAAVARFGDADVERLLADARIIRNRLKIEAVIGNARAVLALAERGGSVSDLLWGHAPRRPGEAPQSWADVPATTPESVALAKALKAAGLRFVGPTTAYAAMQACGVVNDHFAACPARAACEQPSR
ncbi:DNA-3-methyladenine glycosylase I [Kineococcus xinjiangensis]|uniref:DNA-3-methyladenine glycosylase I n=1 Tax=Kineococcus xinjiangensis TaxID=512762 RepID=UPI002481F1E9|nr:DNA-3-methyladenine glycosylase I [Kineococcus xinjiangensis]